MARPVIAFLTDFGTQDHYVGAMKGVALGICPDAALVDITHDIAPQDILGGALELSAVYTYFPAGTVFVVVIDPGVGTSRRGIALDAGGYQFVAPDNGVLSWVGESPLPQPARVVELTNPAYARVSTSRTFEGRDRFAPAAAWLATGIDVRALGPELASWQRMAMPPLEMQTDALIGEVLRVDRFGNLITNIRQQTVEDWRGDHALDVFIGETPAGPIAGTYGDASPGSPCALFGSSGHLEIAITGGHAADHFGLARGARVRVCKR